jgi:hypothetical protein
MRLLMAISRSDADLDCPGRALIHADVSGGMPVGSASVYQVEVVDGGSARGRRDPRWSVAAAHPSFHVSPLFPAHRAHPVLRRSLTTGTHRCQRLLRRSTTPSPTARSTRPAWPARNSSRPGPPRSPAPRVRPTIQPNSLPRRYPRESSVSLRPGVPGRFMTSDNHLPINRDGARHAKTHHTGDDEPRRRSCLDG